jgi:hypothetical protein
MPPFRIDEIMANLHLHEDHTSIFRLSTDRPNIFFAVHKMQNPVGSYHDLAFVIKQHMSEGDPLPPKFLVFFNSRAEAQAGAEFLRQRLAPELKDKVKWFHSGMTDEFQEVVLKIKFKRSRMEALLLSRMVRMVFCHCIVVYWNVLPKIYALHICITAYYGILCLLCQLQLWELNHLVGTPQFT